MVALHGIAPTPGIVTNGGIGVNEVTAQGAYVRRSRIHLADTAGAPL